MIGFALRWAGSALGLVPGVAWVVIGLSLVLSSWALLERSGRLSCRADLVEVRSAYAVLADKVREQNEAVNGWKDRADAAASDAARALADWERSSARERDLVTRYRAAIATNALLPKDIPAETHCEAGQDYVRERMR